MSSSLEAPVTGFETTRNPLEKTLLRDFYLSFQFSQGRSGLQYLLYEQLGAFYASSYGEEDNNWVQSNVHHMLPRFTSLATPKSHLGSERDEELAEVIRDTFREEGTRFIQALENPLEQPFKPVNLTSICDMVIEKDRSYQKKARGYQATDQHLSYFRDYVLFQQPTGSEAFDAIFSRLANGVQDESIIPNRLAQLTHEWENNHPDQQFYPEAV